MASLLIVGVGDCKVTRTAGTTLATYGLGSCIAVAIHDPVANVGGLLHFMLPESSVNPARAGQYPFVFADTGLPLLFRAAYRLGAHKRRLVVLAIGGAGSVHQKGLYNIGRRNHLALQEILRKAGLIIHGEEVGGTAPRTVRLEVDTGRLLIHGDGTPHRELVASRNAKHVGHRTPPN